MTSPLVSVCMPNLNTAPYLQERVETVFAQTYANWELVVSDNYSEDGAWELLQRLARQDSRVSLAQAPREGMYANWNRCLERARGEYIYIATSDDTMPPDCLGKLVAALELHRECDIAHCPIRVIDAKGNQTRNGWYEQALFGRTSAELLSHPHIRKAPFDGLLHLLGESVYVSITQLLIRRSLFDRVGLFESQWGSIGDFHWDMRAALVANTVHVPDTWGGWRLHATQATAGATLGSDEHGARIDTMIKDAADSCREHLPALIGDKLRNYWMPRAQHHRLFDRNVDRYNGMNNRVRFAMRQTMKGSTAGLKFLAGHFVRVEPWEKTLVDDIRQTMADAGLGPVLREA